MAATIPIQNVYYLLCYAWGQMREGEIVETGALDQTELVDLFAQVLINGTRRVLRQGLDRGYVTHAEDTSWLRGRIDFSASLKRALLPRAQAHCHYDTLSRDVLHNRILKSTLRHLAQTPSLDDGLRADMVHLCRRLADVEDVPLRRSLFRRVQLHGNNAFYRFLLNVCALVESNLIVEEEGHRQRFRDFRHDNDLMAQLFENFVYEFYRHEQDAYQVERPHIQWDIERVQPASRERIPIMRTDIVLRSREKTIILDTKYSSKVLKARYDKGKFRSKHLYQLFAYLKNAEAKGGGYEEAEGMLLYPTVEVELDDAFTVQGHRMRVCTINLAQEWQDIHADLLALVRNKESVS